MPKDKDTKTEHGLRWVYRDPPGAWELDAAEGPLQVRFNDPELDAEQDR